LALVGSLHAGSDIEGPGGYADANGLRSETAEPGRLRAKRAELEGALARVADEWLREHRIG